MEYVAWALYCYIVIQLINDGRKQQNQRNRVVNQEELTIIKI